MKHVDLYTDGACSGNPGAGGYGAILIFKGIEREISGEQQEKDIILARDILNGIIASL